VRLGDGDPQDISNDGKWVISRLIGAPSQIALLPTGTGTPRQLTRSDIAHSFARFLPDNRIFLVGNQPNHPIRTYLLDLDGNEKPFGPDGVRALAATSDGKRLLTTDADFSQFQLLPLDGGPAQPFSQLQNGDRPIDFTPDDSALLGQRQGQNDAVETWRVELPSAKRTLLHSIALPGVPAISNGLNATVSRDGKSYAYQHHPINSTEYLVRGMR